MNRGPAQGAGELLHHRTLGELGRVTAGKLISLSSLVLCNLLVARASSDPAEYGRYAAALSLALILDASIGFPLDISTVRFAALHAREPERIDRLQAAAFRLKIFIGLALLGIVATSGPTLSRRLLNEGASGGLLSITVLCTLALLIVRSTAVRLQVHGRFTRYACLDAAQGVFRLLAITLPIVLAHRSAEVFLIAHFIGTALTFVVGLFLVPQGYLRASWPARRDIREAAVYMSFIAGIVVLGTITGRADVPIIASTRSADEAGQYAVALQIAALLTMLASYGSVVMQPRVIQKAREGRLGTLVRWNVLGAGILSAATIPFALWGLPIIIPALFGPRYAAAIPIVAVLLIGTCADLFFMPVMMMLAIQVLPAVSLAAEIAITLGFFGAVMTGVARTTMAMAWLVTGIRLTKLLLYACIALAHVRRTRDKSFGFEKNAPSLDPR